MTEQQVQNRVKQGRAGVQILQRDKCPGKTRKELIMKRTLILLSLAGVVFWPTALSLAEEKSAAKPSDTKQVEAKADISDLAGVRAEMHRTMAGLIEAQSAKEPDPAKIDQLTKHLQQLRTRAQGQSTAAANPSFSWGCPWGGPGMGWGRGAGLGPGGGRGRGMGPGAGWGRGVAGPAFVDNDRDGICDNYELRHGMHK